MVFYHMKYAQLYLFGKCTLKYVYIKVILPIMWAKIQNLDNVL